MPQYYYDIKTNNKKYYINKTNIVDKNISKCAIGITVPLFNGNVNDINKQIIFLQKKE